MERAELLHPGIHKIVILLNIFLLLLLIVIICLLMKRMKTVTLRVTIVVVTETVTLTVSVILTSKLHPHLRRHHHKKRRFSPSSQDGNASDDVRRTCTRVAATVSGFQWWSTDDFVFIALATTKDGRKTLAKLSLVGN